MSRIPHDNGDISTRKTMDHNFFICKNINLFGYSGAGGGGASIIRLGPSWFTSTLSFIYIYLSNMEGSNLISIFLIKIQNTVKLEYIKVQGT